jgi:hypothetical protein
MASIHTGSSITNYVDSSASSSASATLNTTFYIYRLKLGGNNEGMDGTLQEVISWPSDQSSNRTGIETDINSEFLIYQPTDAPASGLLATYTGAAAAYSVRQLSDKAVIAMRIRRDSDDEERNIGFDSNGDLDTTAISDFCQTANGYVTRWWDQSTNGNHADQATDAIQPQIYNGTAVITKNAKPAIEFNEHWLGKTGATGISGLAQSSFFVGDAANNNSDNYFVGSGVQSTGQSRSYTSEYYMRYVGSTQNYSGFAELNVQRLHAIVCPGTISNISAYDWYRDGTLLTPTTSSTTAVNSISGTTNIGIGNSADLAAGNLFNGNIQEAIIWNSDQSSNRTGIETDINSYFSIY